MWAILNENPTREKIILLLKKRGPMAIDDLSSRVKYHIHGDPAASAFPGKKGSY